MVESEFPEAGTECELDNTQLRTIYQDDNTGYYWCPYCGSMYSGSDIEETWTIYPSKLSDKVNW